MPACAVGICYGSQRAVIDEVDDDSLVLAVQAFDGALRAMIVGSAAGGAAVPALPS